MIRLINIELNKMFRRPRSYIGFLAVGIIVFVVLISLKLEGPQLLDFILQQIRDSFILEGNLLNGYLTTFIILNSLWLHIPILIILICGDLVSGEMEQGTIRLLLVRPVSRFRLITAKYATVLIYTFLLVLFLALSSLLLGILFFGKGDLIVFMQTLNIIAQEDVLWRFIGAFTFGMLSMWVVGGLAFLFSSVTAHSLSAMLSTLGLVIVLSVFSTMELGIFDTLSKYLFTSYLSSWRLFFEWPVNSREIFVAVGILSAHLVLFYILSLILFIKKDIVN